MLINSKCGFDSNCHFPPEDKVLISKKYLTPELVHVFEVHEFEGVLVGAAAAHHGVDLGSTLLGSGQREYYPPSY